jgi:Protein of unknown function (DUF2442)
MKSLSNNGTATLADDEVRAVDLKFTKDSLIAYLEDGRAIEVPLEWYPRLAHAPVTKLRNYEWIGRGLGITWPELDEDLSIEGFLKGVRAPRTGEYMNFPWRKDLVSTASPRKRSKPIPHRTPRREPRAAQRSL